MLELVVRTEAAATVVRVVRGCEVLFEARGTDRDTVLYAAECARVKMLARAFFEDNAPAGYRLREEPAPTVGALEAADEMVCRHGGVM